MSNINQKKVIQDIFASDGIDSLIDGYRMRLSAYVEAELDGQNAALKYPELDKALGEFEELQLDYEDLKDLFAAERAGQLREPSQPVQVDLATIKAQAAIYQPKPVWQEVERVGKKMLQLVESIRIQVRDGIVELTQPLDNLSVEMVPLAQVRSHASSEIPKITVPNAAGDGDLAEISILSLTDSTQISVQTRDQGKPAPKRRVIKLLDHNQETLQTLFTKGGEAIFYVTQTGHYFVSIQDDGEMIIPLDINVADN